jgi:hypothetical protein
VLISQKGMDERGEPRKPLTLDWWHHYSAVCGVDGESKGEGGLRAQLNEGDLLLW